MSKQQEILGLPVAGFAVLVILALLLVTQSFEVVQPGYRGVSVTLGKVDPNFREEGLTFKMPFVETIYQLPVKQITVSGVAQCFSSDLQTVTIAFKALYRIPESKVVELFQEYKGDPYESLLEPRIQDALKQVAALYRAEDLVKNREQVKIRATQIVQKTLKLKEGFSFADVSDVKELMEAKQEIARKQEKQDESSEMQTPDLPAPVSALDKDELDPKMYNTVPLVNLVDLPISNIDLTDELERAIEQKQIKEQEALAKRYELEKAKREAEITVVNAEAEAKAVRTKGAALRSSPEVIELEIAKKWDGKTPSTVVVGKGGGNVLLPLR